MSKIAIIIPSYNDWDFLEPLFDSLFSVQAGVNFVPVIVDDHSNDGTEIKIREKLSGDYANIILPAEKAYFTRACNVGLNWAKENLNPDFYFLLNSDTTVTDGWGSALIATSMKFNAGIIGATLLYPDGRVQHAGAYNSGEHFGINEPWTAYRQDRIVPWVTGAAMCIRADVIEKCGYLPHDSKSSEIGIEGVRSLQYDSSDMTYNTNCRLRGVEIAVSAGCVIYHDTIASEGIRRARGDY